MCLTNAYIVYVKVNKMQRIPKVILKSHHDFWKEVAIAWINPAYYQEHFVGKVKTNTMKKKRSITTISTVSSITTASTDDTTRQVNDQSLNPYVGNLRCRISDDIDHLPIPRSGNKTKCALHRWVGLIRTSGTMRCPSCAVNLCIDCYRIFHKVHNLVEMKDELYSNEKMDKEKNSKATKRLKSA